MLPITASHPFKWRHYHGTRSRSCIWPSWRSRSSERISALELVISQALESGSEHVVEEIEAGLVGGGTAVADETCVDGSAGCSFPFERLGQYDVGWVRFDLGGLPRYADELCN